MIEAARRALRSRRRWCGDASVRIAHRPHQDFFQRQAQPAGNGQERIRRWRESRYRWSRSSRGWRAFSQVLFSQIGRCERSRRSGMSNAEPSFTWPKAILRDAARWIQHPRWRLSVRFPCRERPASCRDAQMFHPAFGHESCPCLHLPVTRSIPRFLAGRSSPFQLPHEFRDLPGLRRLGRLGLLHQA